VPEMDENWTFYTCSGLYAKKGALDRFLYWTAPFLIKIYRWNYIRNSLHIYKMFYLLTTERRETGQASVWETPWCVAITIENSVNKCAYCPELLLVQIPKFGY
jgi:hypothetical protein